MIFHITVFTVNITFLSNVMKYNKILYVLLNKIKDYKKNSVIIKKAVDWVSEWRVLDL